MISCAAYALFIFGGYNMRIVGECSRFVIIFNTSNDKWTFSYVFQLPITVL